MESDGEFEQLSPVGEASIAVPKRMMRRLKRAKSISEICSGSESLGFEKPGDEDSGQLGLESMSKLNPLEEEDELRSGFEGLGAKEDGVGAKKALDFDSMAEDLGEKSEDGDGGLRMGEEIGDLEMKEAAKKRAVSDGTEGKEDESKKRKSKKKKSIGFDELPISSASMNMNKKERREYLGQLRAENQRLLRETRDAAFEPIPVVQKPISSVLEKIRHRKLEISKKFLSMRESYSIEKSDGVSREVRVDAEYEEVAAEDEGDDVLLKMTSEKRTERQNSLENSGADGSSNSNNYSNNEAENNPCLEDPSLSPMTDSRDELLEKTSSSPLEEVMAPSVLAMNLKLNQSHVHEDSSSEEENDKENVNPHAHASSPDGDPVRAFVDEEAEEEDDSDNDLFRFKDEEEDEDEGDDDLKDMIVSQFKEEPIDEERRNELHQKWLEQQDAAGTKKLLQKLKYGLPQNETSLLKEEDDADDKEEDVESDDDEDKEDTCPANSTRMTIKKLKEMIPLMFTDTDDVYVSSDDEEMEKKLLKQRLCKKTEQKANFSSLARDESSRELFCRIKKVNNVPDSRKKAKTSSFSDNLLTGGNRNVMSSKSSFLGRDPKNSLPAASLKRGSGIVRGFIFERDDSNSRSSNSVPEESSETIQQKSRPARAEAKFSSSRSQVRSSASQGTSVADETSSRSPSRSRTPLYEILKRSSLQSSCTSRQTIASGHTESIFAAFKLDKKPAKANPINALF